MLRQLIAIPALLFSVSTLSATLGWNATVLRTLVNDDKFGGCMVQITPQPASRGLDCLGGWVSFSCTGEFTTRDKANQKFQAAQLALVTQTRIFIVVDDLRKHNGFCYATRIDNFRN